MYERRTVLKNLVSRGRVDIIGEVVGMRVVRGDLEHIYMCVYECVIVDSLQ